MNKKFIALLIIFFATLSFVSAQDSLKVADEDGLRPVRDPWACTMLIDNQTTKTAEKGQLEFLITHRMTDWSNGLTDLYGLYGGADIRLGFNYGITDKIQVGFGTVKNSKFQEFQFKYNFLTQNRNESIPFSLTFFENIAICGNDYNPYNEKYVLFTDRFSYFSELLISRKVTDRLSIQAGASISHFNGVDSLHLNNYFGLTADARYKFYNEISFMAEYSRAWAMGNDIKNTITQPSPNFAIGFEFGTGTHAFQLVATNYSAITPQQNYAFQSKEWDRTKLGLGFNITVRF